jgi:hypothetical protein
LIPFPSPCWSTPPLETRHRNEQPRAPRAREHALLPPSAALSLTAARRGFTLPRAAGAARAEEVLLRARRLRAAWRRARD